MDSFQLSTLLNHALLHLIRVRSASKAAIRWKSGVITSIVLSTVACRERHPIVVVGSVTPMRLGRLHQLL
jgi:hypothetical protein